MKDANYGDVISKSAQTASQALDQRNRLAASKMELKEQKRRRIADLLARSLKRDSNFAQLGTEHGDDAVDYQTQAIQDVARGFADTFRGSRRG